MSEGREPRPSEVWWAALPLEWRSTLLVSGLQFWSPSSLLGFLTQHCQRRGSSRTHQHLKDSQDFILRLDVGPHDPV